MVARVFGTVDGVEVVMEYQEGDVWRVPVPLDRDGEYVVEIIAEDGAGNQSYLARMLFAVNTSLLCVHVVPIPCYGVLMEDYVRASLIQDRIHCEVIEPDCCTTGRGT